MRIVFIGPPGAGKGTQAERLARYLEIPHLSTGDVLRQARAEQSSLGKIAGQYLDSGHLVPDSVIVQIVGERLMRPECARGCLFDGFPRTLGQAESLDDLLAEQGTPLDTVLEFHVPEQELLKRLLARRRADDTPSTIEQRFGDYVRITLPLLEHYRDQQLLHSIEGLGSQDEVFDRIKSVVDALPAQVNRNPVQ